MAGLHLEAVHEMRHERAARMALADLFESDRPGVLVALPEGVDCLPEMQALSLPSLGLFPSQLAAEETGHHTPVGQATQSNCRMARKRQNQRESTCWEH